MTRKAGSTTVILVLALGFILLLFSVVVAQSYFERSFKQLPFKRDVIPNQYVKTKVLAPIRFKHPYLRHATSASASMNYRGKPLNLNAKILLAAEPEIELFPNGGWEIGPSVVNLTLFDTTGRRCEVLIFVEGYYIWESGQTNGDQVLGYLVDHNILNSKPPRSSAGVFIQGTRTNPGILAFDTRSLGKKFEIECTVKVSSGNQVERIIEWFELGIGSLHSIALADGKSGLIKFKKAKGSTQLDAPLHSEAPPIRVKDLPNPLTFKLYVSKTLISISGMRADRPLAWDKESFDTTSLAFRSYSPLIDFESIRIALPSAPEESGRQGQRFVEEQTEIVR